MKIKTDYALLIIGLLVVISVVGIPTQAHEVPLVHDYDQIGISHACSYYHIKGGITLEKSVMESIKISDKSVEKYVNGKQNVVGYIVPFTESWEYLTEYQEDCSYYQHVADVVCSASKNVTNTTETCVDNGSEEYFPRTCKKEAWITPNKAYSSVKPFNTNDIQLRYCADIERVFTDKGWEIKVDHIPEFDGIEYPEYAWWSGSYSYRMPIEITPRITGMEYVDYPMNVTVDVDTLISAGKMQPDLQDIRMTDENDLEIPYLTIREKTGNTSVWFNFTGSDVDTKTYYLYYGNVGATNSTTYVFTDFFRNGYHFDDDTVDSPPTGWAGGGFVDDGTFHSGGRDGNLSANFSVEGNQLTLGDALTNGSVEFWVNMTDIGNTVTFNLDDAVQAEKGIVIQNINDQLEYVEIGGTSNIEGAQYNTWYWFKIDWDTITDKWDLTVARAGQRYVYTGLDFVLPSAPITHINRISGGAQAVWYDDMLFRNTSIAEAPASSFGAEETANTIPSISFVGVTQQTPANETTHTQTQTFEANITDPNDDVKILVDLIVNGSKINLTETNSSAYKYSYTTWLSAGGYNITWTANDTDVLVSNQTWYYIRKTSSSSQLQGIVNATYPDSRTIKCISNASACALYQNKSDVTGLNDTVFNLAIGVYNFTAQSDSSENTTGSFQTIWYNVSQAPTVTTTLPKKHPMQKLTEATLNVFGAPSSFVWLFGIGLILAFIFIAKDSWANPMTLDEAIGY